MYMFFVASQVSGQIWYDSIRTKHPFVATIGVAKCPMLLCVPFLTFVAFMTVLLKRMSSASGWVGRYGKCLDIPFGRHLSHGQTLAIKVLLFYFLGPEHNSQLSGTMPPPASVDLDAFPMFFFFWWPLPNKMSVEERRGGPGWLMDIFAECRSTSNAPNCGFWRDANEF